MLRSYRMMLVTVVLMTIVIAATTFLASILGGRQKPLSSLLSTRWDGSACNKFCLFGADYSVYVNNSSSSTIAGSDTPPPDPQAREASIRMLEHPLLHGLIMTN